MDRASPLLSVAVAAIMVAPGGAYAASHVHDAPPRPSHDLRRDRGDVIVVDSKVQKHGRRPEAYVPPHPGWRYAPVGAGHRLPAPFLAARYIVASPPGLPPARGAARWIRYGDDLLLVDGRNRRVIRVVAGRFS